MQLSDAQSVKFKQGWPSARHGSQRQPSGRPMPSTITVTTPVRHMGPLTQGSPMWPADTQTPPKHAFGARQLPGLLHGAPRPGRRAQVL